MASQIAWVFLPACMTARSGLMRAVLARPLRSQWPSSLPGAAGTTAAPRLLSSFRCASLSGDELISLCGGFRRPLRRSGGLGHVD
jgi:hypothetical protein